MDFSSKLLENAVQEIAMLPGIGKRTALRLALHLLKQPKESTEMLSNALSVLREGVIFCSSCHNLSDQPICEICSSPKRNKKLLCVVEDIRDVMAIENTAQFQGIYHVLGGIISPMEGVGPQDLNISSLVEKVNGCCRRSHLCTQCYYGSGYYKLLYIQALSALRNQNLDHCSGDSRRR